MVGMLRRKQRGSGDYEVTHNVTLRNRQVSQRAAIGKNVGTRMTVPMLHKHEQPLSRLPRALLMTPEQCADFLGIKINTLYVMKSQGRIPYRKVGHLLRFDFDEIVEWTKDKEK
jgi:excisionase family DNA binding protein